MNSSKTFYQYSDGENEFEFELYKETKWLTFLITERKSKTIVVSVVNKNEQHLGVIKWYPPWKQYCFIVYNEYRNLTAFNNECLQDMTDVLTELNEDHKKK